MYNLVSNNFPKYCPFGFNLYNAYQQNSFRNVSQTIQTKVAAAPPSSLTSSSSIETESQKSSLTESLRIDCKELCKECDKCIPNKISISITTATSPLQKPKVCQNPPSYISKIEESIRNSSKPISSYETDIIEINGIRGIWLNKAEVENWKGDLPIDQYEINSDPCPEHVKLKHKKCVDLVQDLNIKYLKPPKPPTPGPIIIKQEANIPTAAAPPIIIRQIPDQGCVPSPIIIREKPPTPPEPICTKTVVIPGCRLPPPPRRIIIEKLPPMPVKPQPITVERWLPYEKRTRKVILEKKPADPCVEKPKNAIFEWSTPCVRPKTKVNNLGVVECEDPKAYVKQHGSTLKSSNQLPRFALDAKPPVSLEPAKDHNLVGDLEGLRLINLEKEGLQAYKKYVN